LFLHANYSHVFKSDIYLLISKHTLPTAASANAMFSAVHIPYFKFYVLYDL